MIYYLLGNTYVYASEPMRVLDYGYGEVTQNYNTISHKGVDVVREGYMLDYVTAHSSGTVIQVINNCNINTPDDPTNPGNMVKISHDDGYVTKYLHLAYGSVKVKVGDYVQKGQILGYMGNTGNSNGGHLHFELLKDGVHVNSQEYLNQDLINESSPVVTAISNISSSPVPTAVSNSKPNVFYRVKTKDYGWLSEVQNLNDYAGYNNSPITDIAIGVSSGAISYQVHVKDGGWLPAVTGYDINDGINGYAGIGEEIDAIQVYYYTASDSNRYYKAKYKANNYDFQYDSEVVNGQDGYAGTFGHNITTFAITLE